MEICFGLVPVEDANHVDSRDWPPALVRQAHQPTGGEKLLWQFLALPGQVELQDIDFDQRTPSDQLFANLLAGCLWLRNQQPQAAAVYLGQLPGLARGLARFGDKQEAAGHFEAAKNVWSMAAQIAHNAADIHYGYATVLRRYGGSRDVILRELSEAVRLAPDNWIYRTARGEVYQELGQYDQAVQSFSEALKLTSDPGPIYFQRGLAYQALGRLSEACTDMQQAITLDPAHRAAYSQALCVACPHSELCP